MKWKTKLSPGFYSPHWLLYISRHCHSVLDDGRVNGDIRRDGLYLVVINSHSHNVRYKTSEKVIIESHWRGGRKRLQENEIRLFCIWGNKSHHVTFNSASCRQNVAAKSRVYDSKGRLLSNGKDMCDCLDVDCMGCFYPCPECCSRKCGVECRCDRKWLYEQVEVEGGEIIRNKFAT